MTMTIERHQDVGTRRPRHRLAEPAYVVAGAAVADAVRAFGDRLSLDWSARMTARVAVVVVLALGLLLGFGALVLVEPTRAAPYAPVVTPSPTPYPGGWTYRPR